MKTFFELLVFTGGLIVVWYTKPKGRMTTAVAVLVTLVVLAAIYATLSGCAPARTTEPPVYVIEQEGRTTRAVGGPCPVGGPAVEVGTVTMDVGIIFGDKKIRGTMPVYGIQVQRIADGMGLWVCLDSGVLFVAPRQSGRIEYTPYKTPGGGAVESTPIPKAPDER